MKVWQHTTWMMKPSPVPEDQLPYDSLQMSQVGLRSEYSDGGRHGNALHADTGGTSYESLRRSDVGLTSEYSEIGATRTSQ
ncbi:hypothetical protein V1264_017780 [Littorina saxatilis]|uniref:Uncharacterized protein n=1 Tax=Littorina saxatilis TaxID=31220 RepID=A0AAN9GFI8_9CAEN